MASRARPGPARRDWNTIVCFSCGKSLDRGGPGNEYSLTRTRSDDLIYSVVRVSGPDGSGGPCDEDSSPQTGADTPLHCDPLLGMVTFLRVLLQKFPGRTRSVSRVPGDSYRDEICLSPVNPRSELTMWDELSNRLLCDVGVIAVAL